MKSKFSQNNMHTTTPLAEHMTAVVAQRESFRRELELLPPGIGRRISVFYDERIKRASPLPLLGEMAPYMLMDILGLDNEQIEPIKTGWLSIYLATLALDDVIDGETTRPKDNLIVSMLLLQRGLTAILPLISKHGRTEKFNKAIEETALAGLNEVERHHSIITEFPEGEVLEIGRKISLLKICAYAALSTTPRVSLLSEEMLDNVLEQIAQAVQLLDDISDWRTDIQSKNFTYLLTESFVRFGMTEADINKLLRLSDMDIILMMVDSEALEKTVNYAARALRSVESDLNFLGCGKNTPTFRYIRRLICNCELLTQAIMEVKRVTEQDCSDSEVALQILQNRLVILAQSC